MCAAMHRLAVIGGGSAGCQAALYGAKAGLEVTVYEKGRLGGTCLHTGCMPTKALLHAGGTVDWAAYAQQLKTKLLLLERGLAGQLRRAGVSVCRQEVTLDRLPEADTVLLALGEPGNPLPQVPGKQIFDHRTVLELPRLPGELAIVGGGVSGLEYAQLFAALGVSVTVYEQAERILPDFPEELALRLMEICQQEGIAFVCGAPVELDRLPQSSILWAAGRGPWQSEAIEALARAGIQADCRGIAADASWRTSLPHVYAVGDCTGRTHTAYEAAQAARAAVDAMLGRPPAPVGAPVRVVCGWYDLVCLGCSQGLQATARMDRSGYALLRDRMDGMVRLSCDPADGTLTGAQLLYPGAAEAGALLAAAVNARMPVQTLTQTLFFHPAYAETIQEAAVELHDLFRKQANGAGV